MTSPSQSLVTDIPRLAPRSVDSHKGTFGRVLVVAGSMGMSGAAVLAGTAALHAGAGLVIVATPRSVQPVVATGHPCAMTVPLDEDSHGHIRFSALGAILRHAGSADAMVVGPGLGNTSAVGLIVRGILAGFPRPVVLDADALNVLGEVSEKFPATTCPVVLTPHPGEFARLTGVSTAVIQANRVVSATRFAEHLAHRVAGGVLVLKGAGTIVADRSRFYVNRSGNPGMATGGSGDVLAGVIGALLAQNLPAFDAACLGVHLHGVAGDFARDAHTEHGMTAMEIADAIPRAFQMA